MNEFTYTTEVTGKIVNIPISLLFHHPDNPRKDLGDLTELADSIRAKGVMQNLTVVPFRDQANVGAYYVVIGNRRMEASKQAGLKTLPCIISDMPYKDQLATMLLENMQRVDLTPLEQAQGFQLMIDFGETVDGISDKTGFSKTTVRRRLEIAKLDKKLLADAADRQITLADLDKLTELDDVDERNEVLKFIGTANFSWHLSQAKERQARREREDEWRKVLVSFGLTEIPAKEGWNREDLKSFGQYRLDLKKAEEFETDEDLDGCFFFFDYGWVYLTGPKPEEEEKPKVDPVEQARKECCARLKEISDRAHELRETFIKNLTEAEAKKGFAFAISAVACNNTYVNYGEEINKLLDFEKDEEDAEITLHELYCKHPYRTAALLGFIACWGCARFMTYTSWRGEYSESARLNDLYNYLTHFGYEISDEEKALLDGTHEAYFKEEEE